MKTQRALAGLTMAAILATGSISRASVESFGFYRITNNSSDAVATLLSQQLSLKVYDKSGAETAFPGLINNNKWTGHELLFVFANDVGIASSICDVYFDDRGTLLSTEGGSPAIWNSLGSAGVNFSVGASPSNLPGGNSVDFTASAGMDSNSPVSKNGVSAMGELLGVSFDLKGSNDWNDVIDAFDDGSLRVGLRLQGLPNEQSDSFIAPPPGVIPEPISLAIWSALAGVVGLVSIRRR
jgi:hypothetical protein